jgi:hypothetical protein
MNDFKAGEDVTFEVLEDGDPRWDVNEDRGRGKGSSKRLNPPAFVTGKVAEANSRRIVVEHGTNRVWYWHQPSYNTGKISFGKEGYLQRANDVKVVVTSSAANNDGRLTCYVCGASTRKCGGLRYDVDYRVCTKCGK